MKLQTVFLVSLLTPTVLPAGPYAPAAGLPGSTAIDKDSPALVAWADRVADYSPGEDVGGTWQDSSAALGPAEGNVLDIVSLGRGGSITLEFDPPDHQRDWSRFCGLREWVLRHVSGVGLRRGLVGWRPLCTLRQPLAHSGPRRAVREPRPHQPSMGFASKYRVGFGTPFDLADLPVPHAVDLNSVTHVRLVDVIGGTDTDSEGGLIYDPFPTTGSAGFDLDAVGVIHSFVPPIEILSVAADGSNILISWESEVNTNYRIDSADDLTGEWVEIGEVTATGGTTSHGVLLGASPQRYFRIRAP